MGRRKVKSNFKLLDKFTYFVPDVRQLVLLIFFFLIGCGIAMVLTFVLMLIFGADTPQEYLMVVSYPVMFIPAMIYASIRSSLDSKSVEGVRLEKGHFAPVGGLCCALVAVAGTLALSFVSDAVTTLLPQMPEYLKSLFQEMTGGNVVINLICVSVFAPFFEEWLCRGMVLRGLLGHSVKPAVAIVVSAVFFALIHANPWQAVPAFATGLLFGYVYYKTGSLRLTMLMHCANNTLAVILGNIDAFAEMESWREVLVGNEYYAVLAACCAVVILCVFKFREVGRC